jgi:hypothetical protein
MTSWLRVRMLVGMRSVSTMLVVSLSSGVPGERVA